MTERKPADTSFESWVDKQIREAADRGELDNLPGTGKPLPGIDRRQDEHWWLRDYLTREGLSGDELLPTPLRLRKEIEKLPDTVRLLPTEQDVRDAVKELNLRIVEWLRAPSGPAVRIGPVDADDVVRQWRANRPTRQAPSAQPPVAAPRRPRWWHRLIRRREPG